MKKFKIGQIVYVDGGHFFEQARVIGPGHDKGAFFGDKGDDIYLEFHDGISMYWDLDRVLTEKEMLERVKNQKIYKN